MNNWFRKEVLLVPTVLVLIIWGIFLLETFFGFKECYGIIPLSFKGLRGVFLAPLFHGGIQHIFSNTPPLFVLTMLTFYFYDRLAYFVLINGWVFSGFLVWILPDFSFMNSSVLSCHVGASGIIYMLAFFLFFSGVLRREIALMAVSLTVVFLYGSIVWGLLPQEFFGIQNSRISWESHFSGAAMGIVLAILLRKIGRKKALPKWGRKNYNSTDDNALWKRYKEQYPDEFEDTEQKIQRELEEQRRKSKYINQFKDFGNNK